MPLLLAYVVMGFVDIVDFSVSFVQKILSWRMI
jgi:hypothetical protein